MKRRVVESSVLFASIVKWLFLATGAGILVGLSTTVFLKALGWSISATAVSLLLSAAAGSIVPERAHRQVFRA